MRERGVQDQSAGVSGYKDKGTILPLATVWHFCWIQSELSVFAEGQKCHFYDVLYPRLLFFVIGCILWCRNRALKSWPQSELLHVPYAHFCPLWIQDCPESFLLIWQALSYASACVLAATHLFASQSAPLLCCFSPTFPWSVGIGHPSVPSLALLSLSVPLPSAPSTLWPRELLRVLWWVQTPSHFCPFLLISSTSVISFSPEIPVPLSELESTPSAPKAGCSSSPELEVLGFWVFYSSRVLQFFRALPDSWHPCLGGRAVISLFSRPYRGPSGNWIHLSYSWHVGLGRSQLWSGRHVT